MEYGFKNKFQQKPQKQGGGGRWKTIERMIEKKTLYNSVVLKVLSWHILNCIGTGKIFKTSREIHDRVQCIISIFISRVCVNKCNSSQLYDRAIKMELPKLKQHLSCL